MAKKKRSSVEQPDRYWRMGSIIVFLVALSVTLLTIDDVGLTWDEPFSIFAGRDYAAWFGELPGAAFHRDVIDGHWRKNHEHPPLAKLAMGVAQMALGDDAGVIRTSRFAAAFLFALLVEAVFLFGGRTFGGLAGVFAAASLLCMPRVFGHGHLASLDVPMALTWLLAAAAFARAMRGGGLRWVLVAGLCLGLALLTKINAVLLPAVLALWALACHRHLFLWRPPPSRGSKRARSDAGAAWLSKAHLARACWPLAWVAVVAAIGLGVMVAGWPWLWPDVAGRLGAYLEPIAPRWLVPGARPTWRVSIPVLYFGTIYARQAPFHYPLVMTLATVPIGVLFLACVGVVRALRRFRRDPMLALLVVNAAAILGAFMLPGVPKYDGVRLFLPVFPFVALLAGVGGQRCWAWVARRAGRRHRLPLLLTVVLFMIHPYELSYYNALTGGLWGADKLGLETTYWHDPVNRRLFRWLNDPRNPHCRRGDAIAFYPVGEYVVQSGPPRGSWACHDCGQSFPAPPHRGVPPCPACGKTEAVRSVRNDLYEAYYLVGPKRLRAVRFERGVYFDLLVLNARKAMLRTNPTAWRIFTRGRPLFEIRKQGVLLCAVYGRR